MREAVGGHGIFTLGTIWSLFESEGFKPAPDESPGDLPESRRELCDRFHLAIDWSSPDEAQRYLHLVERVIHDYEDEVAQSPFEIPDYSKRARRLRDAVAHSGITTDAEGHLRLQVGRISSGPSALGTPSESDIRMHAQRLGRLDQEPEEMIGAAKELVEATAKHALLELGIEPKSHEDVAALSKQALKALSLHPEAIAPTTRGAETIRRMLAGLQQIAAGLAELRNEGYGTGHGRGRRIPGIKQRHADFVARSAITYAEMVLDTLHDPDAPWRA
jgi:Abortive infection C-terminus